jgi:putative ABC transport system ATP-binding protein
MILQLQGVSKRYDGPTEVVCAVDRVNLALDPGEMVALYGPSGSGKSTLLLLAAGLIAPDEGIVRFEGLDVSSLDSSRYLREDIGFIEQRSHLMPGVQAAEQAAVKLLADRMPLREARRQAARWLDRVGLEERLRHAPEQMSGGERQRVAIARALVKEPSLILADEPTGNLDSERGMQILELLSVICREQQASVLLVTHDPQAASIADRVLTLRDGKLQDGHVITPTLRSAG